jgi:allantoinase
MEMKLGKKDKKNVFLAKSGFGGTEFLLTALISEGKPRGLSYNKMAELTSWNPARRFGLKSKGDIAPGFDADIVLVDPNKSFVAGNKVSESEQGYSVFEGMEMSATVTSTYLRGRLIYDNGKAVGKPGGQYLHRPYG